MTAAARGREVARSAFTNSLQVSLLLPVLLHQCVPPRVPSHPLADMTLSALPCHPLAAFHHAQCVLLVVMRACACIVCVCFVSH